MIKNMVMVNILGLMEENIKEYGLTGNSMDKEFIY